MHFIIERILDKARLTTLPTNKADPSSNEPKNERDAIFVTLTDLRLVEHSKKMGLKGKVGIH